MTGEYSDGVRRVRGLRSFAATLRSVYRNKQRIVVKIISTRFAVYLRSDFCKRKKCAKAFSAATRPQTLCTVERSRCSSIPVDSLTDSKEEGLSYPHYTLPRRRRHTGIWGKPVAGFTEVGGGPGSLFIFFRHFLLFSDGVLRVSRQIFMNFKAFCKHFEQYL